MLSESERERDSSDFVVSSRIIRVCTYEIQIKPDFFCDGSDLCPYGMMLRRAEQESDTVR